MGDPAPKLIHSYVVKKTALEISQELSFVMTCKRFDQSISLMTRARSEASTGPPNASSNAHRIAPAAGGSCRRMKRHSRPVNSVTQRLYRSRITGDAAFAQTEPAMT